VRKGLCPHSLREPQTDSALYFIAGTKRIRSSRRKPVSRTASGEIRQNDAGLVRLQGIGNICRRVGQKQVCRPQAHKAGQLFPAQVLPDLQRKGPVRQRSLSDDLSYSRVVCFFIGVHEIAALSFGYFVSKTK